MPRWLRILLVVCALATTSGLPTVVAATVAHDGCADDCGDDDGSSCPDDGTTGCPPFCHGCACVAPCAVPSAAALVAVIVAPPRLLSVPFAVPARQAPPPRDVFHPPRPRA